MNCSDLGFVDQFISAISTRHLDRCEQILVELAVSARERRDLVPWHTYLTGILVIERDNDWACAERIYEKLLAANDIDPLLRVRILRSLGIAYHYEGRWRKAVDTLMPSHELARDSERPWMRSKH